MPMRMRHLVRFIEFAGLPREARPGSDRRAYPCRSSKVHPADLPEEIREVHAPTTMVGPFTRIHLKFRTHYNVR